MRALLLEAGFHNLGCTLDTLGTERVIYAQKRNRFLPILKKCEGYIMAEKKKAAAPAAAVATDKKKRWRPRSLKSKKNYGKGAIMRLGDDIAVNVEAIPTGSLSLDLALGIGGVPRGRIVEIYGPESCGKTTLALHIVASAQKSGGEAAYIDVEHALEPAYAARSAWISIIFSSPSRTPASRRSTLPKRSCAPARWTWSWWTPWPLSSPQRGA